MNIIRLQGETELRMGIYYEYDSDSTPLGEGGMGRVFKGYRVNQRTGERTPVAIKAIYENIPERVVERARREAEIQVEHDNLIRMYGFVEAVGPAVGDMPGKTHYHVIMELIVGVTLEDILNGITTDKHGMQIPFAAELYNLYRNQKVTAATKIMKAVLAGLMALHDRGIIHRDIDPSNIMITFDNKIKLIDFGICKQIVTLGSQDRGLTAAGVFMGKVNYAAPELVLGDVKSQSYTTDIYAMGVLLYLLMTGHLPFSGTDQEILTSNLRKNFPLKDVKRPDVKKIIQKATEKSQAKRFGSVAEMRVALEHIKPDESSSKLSGKVIGGIAAGVIVIIGIIIWSIIGKPSEDNPKASATVIQDTIPVAKPIIKPSSSQLLTSALAFIETNSEDSIAEGSKILITLVNDSAYSPAFLQYGILQAKATKAFPEVAAQQSKLGIKPDLNASVDLLTQVLAQDPANYKAAYWIYNNLMTKFEEDRATGDDIKQMVSTFKLCKKLMETASDEEDIRYREAMKNADDENTLKAWAVMY